MYTDNYMQGFSASNYMQAEDIVYAFTTTETQMYVDATVHANWNVPGPYPRPSVNLINKRPDFSFTNLKNAFGDFDAVMEDGYCYYAQTYYLVVDKWTAYSFPYDLEVNLYRTHDFKRFSFTDLNVQGDIDYTNRIVTLTVPKGTDLNALVATYDIPEHTEVLVDGVTQISGSTAVDFTNNVTYTINQTISPKTTETWTVKVEESTTTAINELDLQKLIISPNPVKDIITISAASKNYAIDKVSIFSASGTLVLSQATSNSNTIDVNKLKPGIYFINIEVEGSRVVKKFIKK